MTNTPHQVHTDMDWSTIIRWQEQNDAMHARVTWTVPLTIRTGTYRIKHFGNYRLTPESMAFFEADPQYLQCHTCSADIDKKSPESTRGIHYTYRPI